MYNYVQMKLLRPLTYNILDSMSWNITLLKLQRRDKYQQRCRSEILVKLFGSMSVNLKKSNTGTGGQLNHTKVVTKLCIAVVVINELGYTWHNYILQDERIGFNECYLLFVSSHKWRLQDFIAYLNLISKFKALVYDT